MSERLRLNLALIFNGAYFIYQHEGVTELGSMCNVKKGICSALSKRGTNVYQLTSHQNRICEDCKQITLYLETDCTLD